MILQPFQCFNSIYDFIPKNLFEKKQRTYSSIYHFDFFNFAFENALEFGRVVVYS